MPAEFLFLRAEADARHILFDDEAAYALGAIVARADHHDIDFVLATTGDELLGTCDDIIVPVPHRFGFEAARIRPRRSEEHTSELQSLMRISYAVFCLKKKTNIKRNEKS